MTDEYPTPTELQETMMVVNLTAILTDKGSGVNSAQIGDLVARWIVFNKPRHDWAKALSRATDILAVIAERIDSLADEIEDGADPLVTPPPITTKVAEFDSDTREYMRRYLKRGAQ